MRSELVWRFGPPALLALLLVPLPLALCRTERAALLRWCFAPFTWLLVLASPRSWDARRVRRIVDSGDVPWPTVVLVQWRGLG